MGDGKYECLQEGQIFEGRFQILSVIGKGGAGTVYKAKHTHMDKIVAIKTLISSVGWDDNETFLRFEKESKAASALGHPNIISILDFGRSVDGHAYLVMEYLGSNSLDDVLKQQRRLDTERFYRIFSQICDGLQHAHKKGIVHRDIKPSNIMLMDTDEATDVVKIVDFGLAKLTARDEDIHLTKTGAIMGTPLYMSPEQCRGLELDHRSDIYSLGCVMYKSLTGRLPVIGATPLDTLFKHTTENPPSFGFAAPELTLPSQLEQAILRSLSKNPDDRQQSMAELRKEIQAAILTSGSGGKRVDIPAPMTDTANADQSQSRTVKTISGPILEAKKPVRTVAGRSDDLPTSKPKIPAAAMAIGAVLLVIVGGGAYFLRGVADSNAKPAPSTAVESVVAPAVSSKQDKELRRDQADEVEETPRTLDSQLAKKERTSSGSEAKIASASISPHPARPLALPIDQGGRDAKTASRLVRQNEKLKNFREAQAFFKIGEWTKAKAYWEEGLKDELGPSDVEKFVVSAHLMACDLKLGTSIAGIKPRLDHTLALFDKRNKQMILGVNKRGLEARYVWRTLAQMSFLAEQNTQGEPSALYKNWTACFFKLADDTWTSAQKVDDPRYQLFLNQYQAAMAFGVKPKPQANLPMQKQPQEKKPPAARTRGGPPRSTHHGSMVIREYRR